MHTILLSDIISSISLVIALLSAIAAAFSYQSNVIHDRKRDTLDAFNTLQKEVFDNLNRFRPSDIQEIAKHPTSNEYNELSGYIARLEHFCVGVNQKIYDFKTVYMLAHGYLDSKKIRTRIDPIINRKNHKGNEDYYSNIHSVLKKMEKYQGF